MSVRLLLASTLAAATAVFAAATTIVGAGPAQAATKEPVILVHGFLGSASNFTEMKAALERAGYPAYAINLPGQENIANAKAIAKLVKTARAEHGGGRVSLVGHSMGGLSTRYYLKSLGGTDAVTSYLSMGTSQHGYQPACVLLPDLGGQMCPSSAFIKQLNSGDGTPGAVRYATLNSSLDKARVDKLEGAWCDAEFPGVQHADEPKSPVFISAVQKALTGECPKP